jgi:hypothetical protein
LAPGNHAAVVIREHNYGSAQELRVEDTLARDVKVIAVD